jgi:hypothetical protein
MVNTKNALVLFFILTTFSLPLPLLSETQKIYLTYYTGTVNIFRKQTLVYPEINKRLYPGDSLTTGDNSSAEITYEDGSVSSLLPNSSIKIRQAKKEEGLFSTKIKAFFGSVICKVQKLRKGESFQINTPTAVAAVRGTVFETKVGEDSETAFKVLSGELYAKSLIEGAKTYLLKDEFSYLVGSDGIPNIRKLTEKEIAKLKTDAKTYIQNFIEEKKKEVEEEIKKEVKKGCLGFF